MAGRREHSSGKLRLVALTTAAFALGAIASFAFHRLCHSTDLPGSEARPPRSNEKTMDALLLDPSVGTNWDIAFANLICAQGLPGADNLDIARCLATLEEWTARVLFETKRNAHRFREFPEQSNHSKAEFCMGMLVTVLKQDIGVCYDPRLAMISTDFSNTSFEADSRNTFIHGLLQDKTRGSCASIPVVVVAIARRLGYPVALVSTKGHLFVRWNDGAERLNIEAACAGGYNTHLDDHYLHWPVETTKEEAAFFRLLQPMTPADELATFLDMRAMCIWRSDLPVADALCAAARASKVAPDSPRHLFLTGAIVEDAIKGRHNPSTQRLPPNGPL